MKIVHQESNSFFEITEHSKSVKLLDSATNRAYYFKESYEAIWFVIELIRNTSIDFLSNEDLKQIALQSHTPEELSKSKLAVFKKEKVNHTYYDQVFLKLLSHYRSGSDTFVLGNKTNFSIHYEMVYLVRQSLSNQSSKKTAPSFSVYA
jgi:hypothetical protein